MMRHGHCARGPCETVYASVSTFKGGLPMSNNRMLGNEFQTAYESAGGTDILKFLANVKQAF